MPWPSHAQIYYLVYSDSIFHAPWCLSLGLEFVNAVVALCCQELIAIKLPLQGSQVGVFCVTRLLLSSEIPRVEPSLWNLAAILSAECSHWVYFPLWRVAGVSSWDGVLQGWSLAMNCA